MTNLNTINIKAQKIPLDESTNSMLRFKQGDDLAFRLAVFSDNESLASLENVESLHFEIYDIGSYQSPSPRTSTLYIQKIVDAQDINYELSLDDWNDGTSQHATFNVGVEESNLEAGEKWLKISAQIEDQKLITISAGWIEIEENFTNYTQAEAIDVEVWKNAALVAKEIAQESANSATESATSASDSALSASANANTAIEAKTQAEEYATNASASATSASLSSESASDYATSAQAQASSATTSANSAQEQAQIATTQANNANASATSASTSATSASESASTAITQATSASTSASSASTSATSAATSATSASSSASTASSKASEASTSATTATTQATNAATSATSASTSATEATNAVSSIATTTTLAQLAQKKGKFYLNPGAMYATVDLLGTHFESFSICTTINSGYTGTIFSYGDVSSYFMAKVSSSSIVISTSTNGDLISYDCSDLTSENRALVFASDGTTLTLYINGLDVATATLNSDVPSGDNTLTFGSYANTDYFPYAYGQMWNIKVFNFNMSDSSYYTTSDYLNEKNQTPYLNSETVSVSDPVEDGEWNYCTSSTYGEISSVKPSGSLWTTGIRISLAQTITDQNEIQDESIQSCFKLTGGGLVGSGSPYWYFYQYLSAKPNFIRVKFKYKTDVITYASGSIYFTFAISNYSDYSSVSGFSAYLDYSTSWVEFDKVYDLRTKSNLTNPLFLMSSTNGGIIYIADLEIQTFNTVLDLMDFSVAENDSTRKVKDGSVNQHDMTVSGILSGDIDKKMDNYQNYLTTQIAQEINLTS